MIVTAANLTYSYCHIIIILSVLQRHCKRSFPSMDGLVAVMNIELRFNAFYISSLSPVLSNETEWDIPKLNVKNYNPVMTYMHVSMHTHVLLCQYTG